MEFKLNKGVYGGDVFIPGGKISGKGVKAKSNVGRKPTNAEYAKQNGITKRQASKRRRGY